MSKKAFATLGLPVDELERLRTIADSEYRSMSGQVIYWIDQYERTNQAQSRQEN